MQVEKYNPNSLSVSAILGLIASGDIAIPEIQRPFVWKKNTIKMNNISKLRCIRRQNKPNACRKNYEQNYRNKAKKNSEMQIHAHKNHNNNKRSKRS